MVEVVVVVVGGGASAYLGGGDVLGGEAAGNGEVRHRIHDNVARADLLESDQRLHGPSSM